MRWVSALLLLTWLPLSAGACVPSGNEGGVPVYRVGAACVCTSVQQAVDAIGFQGEGIVRIRSGVYNESLYIFNRSVSLIGGHASCTAGAPSPGQDSTLSALGRNEQVVGFQVTTGTRDLSLANLRLTEGDGQSGAKRPFPGGGLSVTTAAGTQADVLLDRVQVVGNRTAFHGGGIALTGAGQAFLTLLNNTRISNNQVTGPAPHGGGVYCQGSHGILMLGGAITNNQAGAAGSGLGLGGGVHLDGCDLSWFSQEREDIGLFNLSLNVAREGGGGLYAAGGSQVLLSGAHFVLFGDPRSTTPFALNSNTAPQGSAVWAVGASARVTLDRAWTFQNNIGFGTGSTFFAQNATIRVERSSPVCHNPRLCSRVFSNDGGNSVFRADQATGRIEISRTIVSGNVAFDAGGFVTSLFNQQFGSTVQVDDSLIHDNPVGDLFSATSALPPQLRVERSTIALNGSAGRVFRLGASAEFRLWDSIVYDPARLIASGHEEASLSIECVLWHDDRMGGLITLVGDPGFIDPDAGQFQLRENSPAINFCPFAPPAPAVDLDWNPRGLCHSTSGGCGADVYDLGAYELPLRVFRDRFETP